MEVQCKSWQISNLDPALIYELNVDSFVVMKFNGYFSLWCPLTLFFHFSNNSDIRPINRGFLFKLIDQSFKSWSSRKFVVVFEAVALAKALNWWVRCACINAYDRWVARPSNCFLQKANLLFGQIWFLQKACNEYFGQRVNIYLIFQRDGSPSVGNLTKTRFDIPQYIFSMPQASIM